MVESVASVNQYNSVSQIIIKFGRQTASTAFECHWKTLIDLCFSETSQQRIVTSLKLTPVYNFNSSLNSCTSLLELFTSSTGGHEARKSFARVTCSEEALSHWHLSLLPLLNHMRHIMYPFFNFWLTSKYKNVYISVSVLLVYIGRVL